MSGACVGEVWRSPVTGAALQPEGAHALLDADGRRWPVVDGIAYLRTGRDDLAAEALARLDAGDQVGALVVLLADLDDWWDGPRPDEAALRSLVRDQARLSLREAMAHLAYGRVGDYFAHRWSDPTYLAGLALLEAHWPQPATAFELACGIGHYLRELAARGVTATGGDVVFSKLWLARHWVAPEARLVCFDAGAPWPVAGHGFDLVLCQDAFYFLEPKPEILARLRAAARPGGLLAVGHIHNQEAPNFSAGRAVTADDIAALFPGALAYDDDELTRALVEARAPRPAPPAALREVEAFAVVEGAGAPRAVTGGLALPPPGRRLALNPLYAGQNGAIRWPSERYRQEYAPRATYPATPSAGAVPPTGPLAEAAARRRELVDLPERW